MKLPRRCEMPACERPPTVEVEGKPSGLRLKDEQVRFWLCSPCAGRAIESGYWKVDGGAVGQEALDV